MAGHSKWANIKHRKERADSKKGKIFSRIAKEIISSVKLGGPDPESNPRLRLALQKARASNVPNDVVDRNIKKASSADTADYVELSYELYGYGGVGIICEAMTDNVNRLASEMRIATNKRGGSLAKPGAVSFNFDRKGIIQISKTNVDEDTLFHDAIEAGAEEFDGSEDVFVVTTDPTDLFLVKEKLAKYPIQESYLEMIPKTSVECDEEAQKSNQALIDWLESIDDIDEVYHNMD
jgi:YebC/PmpR family DNA-binding regulatory protein